MCSQNEIKLQEFIVKQRHLLKVNAAVFVFVTCYLLFKVLDKEARTHTHTDTNRSVECSGLSNRGRLGRLQTIAGELFHHIGEYAPENPFPSSCAYSICPVNILGLRKVSPALSIETDPNSGLP